MAAKLIYPKLKDIKDIIEYIKNNMGYPWNASGYSGIRSGDYRIIITALKISGTFMVGGGRYIVLDKGKGRPVDPQKHSEYNTSWIK